MIIKNAYPQGLNIFGLHIQFYAIFILCGALLAFFLASYKAHKDGYSWDFFETIFFTAFPSGIIGARIWYVIAEWNKEFAGGDFLDVFKIWKGGLAIQGGVIAGILVGCFVIVRCRRGAPLLRVLDYAVPTIFIAQAIGRWGNFMNQEVYGQIVPIASWNFLPDFIIKQMQVSGTTSTTMAVPLYLVEGLLNIGNYYILAHAIPDVLGKHYKDGDSTFAYFILYGITRLFMEPLRNPIYQMGNSNNASWRMAVAFIVVGVVAIIANHLVRYFYPKYKNKENAK